MYEMWTRKVLDVLFVTLMAQYTNVSLTIRLFLFKVFPTLVHCLLLWYMLYHAYNVLSLNCYEAKRLKCKLN